MTQPAPEHPSIAPRRPLRPLHGIPEPEARGRAGIVLSTLLHLAVALLIFLPPLVAHQPEAASTGGGGPGPAGGGGGGTGGTGGEKLTPEQVRFLHVARPPAAATPTTTPPVVPPIVPPVVPPPKTEPEKPPAQVTPPAPPASETTTTAAPAVPTSGSGGGSGLDGSAGNGPGTGGGVGTGVGTGRGSGTGPGTGGGPAENYPPTVIQLALLPIPVPSKVRPYKMVAYFDVDERGRATLISFNPSRDGGYNKKIREMLAEIRFRPAHRPDGTPVRDTTSISAETP